jgi:hypothetical protein
VLKKSLQDNNVATHFGEHTLLGEGLFQVIFFMQSDPLDPASSVSPPSAFPEHQAYAIVFPGSWWMLFMVKERTDERFGSASTTLISLSSPNKFPYQRKLRVDDCHKPLSPKNCWRRISQAIPGSSGAIFISLHLDHLRALLETSNVFICSALCSTQ